MACCILAAEESTTVLLRPDDCSLGDSEDIGRFIKPVSVVCINHHNPSHRHRCNCPNTNADKGNLARDCKGCHTKEQRREEMERYHRAGRFENLSSRIEKGVEEEEGGSEGEGCGC